MQKKWENTVFVYFLMGALFWTLAIAFYQVISNGKIEYYFHKSVYNIFLISSLYLISIIYLFYKYIKDNIKDNKTMVSIMLVASLIFFMGSIIHNFKIQHFGFHSDSVSKVSANLISEQFIAARNTNLIIYGVCSSVDIYSLNKLIFSMNGYGPNLQFDLIKTGPKFEYNDSFWVSKFNEYFDSKQPLNVLTSQRFSKLLDHSKLSKNQSIIENSSRC